MTGNSTIRWLGQAGFEITAPSGATMLIDPYISNWCGENTASQRIVPIALDAATVRPSLVVNTHWHEDHLDPASIPVIGRSSPKTIFVAPPSSGVRTQRWGIPRERIVDLRDGETFATADFSITAGYARHEVAGFLAEDAISLIIEVGGRRIYHSGDTEYDSRIRSVRRHGKFDLGLFVINGTGGNMNLREAAFLAEELDVPVAIPMHYGMWSAAHYGADATLDPQEFARRIEAGGKRRGVVMAHGETIAIP